MKRCGLLLGRLCSWLLISFPRALSSHSRQRRELAPKSTWPRSPVTQLHSHVPLEGHMATHMISDGGTHGHFACNDDSHLQKAMFPKPWALALSSFNPDTPELVGRALQLRKLSPWSIKYLHRHPRTGIGMLKTRFSVLEPTTHSAASPGTPPVGSGAFGTRPRIEGYQPGAGLQGVPFFHPLSEPPSLLFVFS